MKPFTGYIFLAVAITCGIVANSFAKISDGFTKLTPSVACILLMCVTMFSLAKGMSAIPVGFAYAAADGDMAGVELEAWVDDPDEGRREGVVWGEDLRHHRACGAYQGEPSQCCPPLAWLPFNRSAAPLSPPRLLTAAGAFPCARRIYHPAS